MSYIRKLVASVAAAALVSVAVSMNRYNIDRRRTGKYSHPIRKK